MHDVKRNHLAGLPTARFTCPVEATEATQRVETYRTNTALTFSRRASYIYIYIYIYRTDMPLLHREHFLYI